jgi:dolichol-phosphate mannosyltransferase
VSPTLIVVPTYNERENVAILATRIHQHAPDAHILFVDDRSPDGTGDEADALARANPAQIHVLHRQAKDGLGRAYIAGFRWALERDYQQIVQMDADLSHDPAHLPAIFAAAENADLVLGSRYVPGGGTRNWSLYRRMLSRGGSFYARTILGLPIRDLTGGFKCWRRDALAAIDLSAVRSNGYSFQVELTYRALLQGRRIVEVPITFTERADGLSKMSKKIVLEAIGMVWKLRMARASLATSSQKMSE